MTRVKVDTRRVLRDTCPDNTSSQLGVLLWTTYALRVTGQHRQIPCMRCVTSLNHLSVRVSRVTYVLIVSRRPSLACCVARCTHAPTPRPRRMVRAVGGPRRQHRSRRSQHASAAHMHVPWRPGWIPMSLAGCADWGRCRGTRERACP